MNILAGFLDRLTVTQKAMTALAGAMTAGFTIAGLVFGGQIKAQAVDVATLVASDEAQNVRLTELEAATLRANRQYIRLVCLLTLPDSLNGVEAERACP